MEWHFPACSCKTSNINTDDLRRKLAIGFLRFYVIENNIEVTRALFSPMQTPLDMAQSHIVLKSSSDIVLQILNHTTVNTFLTGL